MGKMGNRGSSKYYRTTAGSSGERLGGVGILMIIDYGLLIIG